MRTAFVAGGLALALLLAYVASGQRWGRRIRLPSARRRREAALASAKAMGGAPAVVDEGLHGAVRLRRVRKVDRSWEQAEVGAALTLAIVLFVIGYVWAYVPGGLLMSGSMLAVWWFLGRDRRKKDGT